MMARITFTAILVSLCVGSHATTFAQQYYPQQPAQASPQAAGPQRPVQQPTQQPVRQTPQQQGPYLGPTSRPVPPGASAIVPQNTPTLQRRAPQTVNAPFRMTPEDQAKVDSVLSKWEEASRNHKRIVIEFFRFEFKPAFATQPNVPVHIDQGEADFTSSGKWMWNVRGEIVNQKLVEGQRAVRWVCDGKSIHEFDFSDKTVTQHVLANDMKGEDMVKVMLPFLFNTDMNKLKERYFIRLLEFPSLPDEQVCIDAWPRFIDEARNFKNARMIVDMTKMEPTGLMLTLPDGVNSYRYQFTKVSINPKNPLDLFNDPFKAKVPSGWTTHVQQMPETQVGARPADGPTR